jgi:hypothetical protein
MLQLSGSRGRRRLGEPEVNCGHASRIVPRQLHGRARRHAQRRSARVLGFGRVK